MKIFFTVLAAIGLCTQLNTQLRAQTSPLTPTSAVTPAAGEVKSVPVKDEPHHHFERENPYIRLYSVAIPANSATLVHRHEKPYIFVAIGSAEFTNAVVGRPEVHSKMADGQSGYSPGGFAHQVKTDAGIPFNNIDVELLQSQGQPRNLCDKVVSQDFGQCDLSRADQSEGMSITPSFETDAVRVDRLQLKRGETHDEIHDHPGLLIMISGATVAVSRIPGVMTQFLKPGDSLWIPLGGQPKFNIDDGADAQLLLLTFKNNEQSAQ
jgi:hypothetical protein